MKKENGTEKKNGISKERRKKTRNPRQIKKTEPEKTERGSHKPSTVEKTEGRKPRKKTTAAETKKQTEKRNQNENRNQKGECGNAQIPTLEKNTPEPAQTEHV